jgi:hypothetical protein
MASNVACMDFGTFSDLLTLAIGREVGVRPVCFGYSK